MTAYLVERYLPGLSETDLAAALDRARETCAELTAGGSPIRYLGSTFLPDEEACLCRFDADRAETVVRANELAEVPFARVTPAVSIPSGSKHRIAEARG
jgi:hypothetical protein